MFRTLHLLFAGAAVALGLSALSAREDDKKPAKDNPAAAAAPRKDDWWQKRHDAYLEQTKKKGKFDVVFLGDSITDAWPGQEAWRTTLKPFNPGGYGIGGDQTQHLLWRITEGKELEGLEPKAAVIMIGTNNTGGHTAEQIAAGIEAVVTALRKEKPKTKILLLGVFPRANPGENPDKVAPKDKLNKKVPEINRIISKLDDGKYVFYKDIGPKFLDDEGGLPKDVMPDLLHLSGKGYQIWADAIKGDLEKLTARADGTKAGKENPAAKAAPREKGWMKRHEKYLEQTKNNKYDVVFLGDSITDAWPGGGKAAWTTTLKPFNPGGYGIGGDQTQHLLWRIGEGKELEGLEPKAAVIMIGTNNTGGHSAEQIAEGIKAVVEKLREVQPKTKILLLGVFPRAGGIEKEDKVAPKEKLNKKIPEINRIISKLDDGKMVFYKDIGDKFLTEDGGLSREVMPDLLHLSKKGYQIWADAIKDDLEKLTK